MANETVAKKSRVVPGPEGRQIMAEPKDLKGNYCNVVRFYLSKHEFVVDFVFHFGTEAHFLSRIITNPPHAKAMLKALQDNVAQYEKKFGNIPEFVESTATPTKH